MSTQNNGHKRPKLSLSTKPLSGQRPKQSNSLKTVNPQSPTAFNTLSNVYVTAIERSTPVTAVDTSQRSSLDAFASPDVHRRLQTPYGSQHPETPLTANPTSPSVATDIPIPSTMTATPPLSAGPTDSHERQKFTFSFDAKKPRDLSESSPVTQHSPRRTGRRAHLADPSLQPPYAHPGSLHSILRNSPLPPRSTRTPMSPRRQSLRLQEKASRRVAYNSPIEQTIITNKYTKSHIDLLYDDASPLSPASSGSGSGQGADTVLDLALAFTEDETRDGGQTPGPFEEMRRRMAGLAAATPVSPSGTSGLRKRKRREKKRRWVWTIGQDGEEDEDEEVSGAVAALRAAEGNASRASSEPPPTLPGLGEEVQVPGVGVHDGGAPGSRIHELPTPIAEDPTEAEAMCGDVGLTDSTASSVADERVATPEDMDVDMIITPTTLKDDGERAAALALESGLSRNDRLGSADLFNLDTGTGTATPVSPDLVRV